MINSSKFIKVKCENCKNEQVIFGKASSSIKCLVCSHILAVPRGSKAKVKSKILEVL